MNTPTSLIFVRPGLVSYTWSYAGTAMQSGTTVSAVDYVSFDASSLLGQEAARGELQYSSDNGRSWTAYALQVDGAGPWIAANGTLWRFQDGAGGDTSTPDSFTARYRLADGSSVAATTTVSPDSQPVGLTGANDTVFSTMEVGDVVDLLSAVDTGSQTGGRWAIGSQSSPGLFAIEFDRGSDTAAKLVIADPARIPQAGMAASVTVYYYDRYQVDANGNPIGNSGVSRTLNYSIEDGHTDSLPGMSSESKTGPATGAYAGSPALATLSGGGFVAVWQAPDQASGGGALWAQLRDASGNAQGAAFALTASGDARSEADPAVAALSGGRFAVAYAVQDGWNGKLAYRVVEADGRVGAERLLDTGGDAGMASLATLSDGSFAIAWRSGGTVRVQQVGADGVALGATASYQVLDTAHSPSIAALPQGGWVLSWGELGDGNVYAALNGGAAFVATPNDGYAASITTAAPLPHVTALAGGGFVVAWDSYFNDQRGFSISDIFFQRFDSAGRALDGVVQANVASGGGRYDAAITALSDGGFLVAWQGSDGEENGVFGRRFGADGTAIDATEFALNQGRAGDQTSPDVKALAGGGFAAAWVDTAADGSASVEVRVLPGVAPAPVGGGSQDGGAGNVSAPASGTTPDGASSVTNPDAPEIPVTAPSTPVTTPSAPVTTPSTPVTVPSTPSTPSKPSAPVTSPSKPASPPPSPPASTTPAKIVGGDGHDKLVAPAGNARLDGLDGLDTVLYDGSRAAYAIAKSGSDVVVSNSSGTLTTLSNVERIKFSDQSVALDIDGNAGEAYRLYQAAFDRTPDKVGLGFWINALDNGIGLHEVAASFIGSGEFAHLYGADASDTQFVQALYANVLHRAPDASGYEFWTNTIHVTTRAEVLVAFSESAENQVQVVGSIQNGIEFTPWA